MASLEELNVPPNKRMNPLSPLLRAKSKALQGQVVNACPFGCRTEHLDQNGYCRHLVGFTRDKETFEPMVKKRGLRVVQVPLKGTGRFEEVQDDDDGPVRSEEVMEPCPPPCVKGDQFVQISDCYRVYRDVDKAKKAV